MPGDRAKALARVGAIIEEPRFHSHLTGRENLTSMPRRATEAPTAAVDGALERVGLARVPTTASGTYSLGMRQRLGVARCLLCDPELLILDEPVNGLDPAGILEFRNLVRDLVEEGRTVLLSSHLLDEVEKTCDVAIVERASRRPGDHLRNPVRGGAPRDRHRRRPNASPRRGCWRRSRLSPAPQQTAASA